MMCHISNRSLQTTGQYILKVLQRSVSLLSPVSSLPFSLLSQLTTTMDRPHSTSIAPSTMLELQPWPWRSNLHNHTPSSVAMAHSHIWQLPSIIDQRFQLNCLEPFQPFQVNQKFISSSAWSYICLILLSPNLLVVPWTTFVNRCCVRLLYFWLHQYRCALILPIKVVHLVAMLHHNLLRKVHVTPLNYHPINNIISKLSIGTMSFFGNIPLSTIDNTLICISCLVMTYVT